MRLSLVGLAATAALVIGGPGLALWPIGQPVTLAGLAGDPQRGAYLARAGGCIACHSDPGSGRPALTGGAPIRTAFGAFVAPNITPHPTSGIGAWSVEDFARALRQGVSPGGEPYYPAFPYGFYAGLSDQDIADMWAAFRGVPPQDVRPVGHEIAFPFTFRPGLKLWRALYAEGPDTSPDPGRSDAWNRGRWLVEGLGHCGACHTDRNALGGLIASRHLAGSDDLPDDGKAPAITTEALHKAGWTVGSLAFALRSGMMPDGDTFGGGMGEVVRDATAWLTPGDREAMALYLLDLDAP